MGLFDRLKKKPADWDSAYPAAPQFYEKPDGTPFGAITLTEGVETILPKLSRNTYAVEGTPVSEWKLVLVSTSKDAVIGEADYFSALKNMEKYVLDAKEDRLLIKGLSLAELEHLGD